MLTFLLHRPDNRVVAAKQEHILAYRQFLREATTSDVGSYTINTHTEQRLSNLKLIQFPSAITPNIHKLPARITSTSKNCFDWEIDVGQFTTTVTVFRINAEVFGNCRDNLIERNINSQITRVAQGSTFYTAKRVKIGNNVSELSELTSSSNELFDALREYAIARICSDLGVAPQIRFDLGFDVVLYNDCLEFYMEECSPVNPNQLQSSFSAVRKRLKYCLAVMHRNRLLHRDIKPSNILFSNSLNDYVFCDFGVSKSAWQPFGYCVQCQKVGTEYYLSPQLKQLSDNQQAYVDLYYSDAFALSMVLKKWKHSRGQSV